jgi:hypothetical protein
MYTLQTVFGTVTCETQAELTALLAALPVNNAIPAMEAVKRQQAEAYTVSTPEEVKSVKKASKKASPARKYTVEGYDTIGRDGKHDVNGYDMFTNNLQGNEHKNFREALKATTGAYFRPTGWKIPHDKDGKPFGKVALQALFDKIAS